MDEEAQVATEVGPLVRIPLAIVCHRYGHFDRYVEIAMGAGWQPHVGGGTV
jgi:hypothetical protein